MKRQDEDYVGSSQEKEDMEDQRGGTYLDVVKEDMQEVGVTKMILVFGRRLWRIHCRDS